MKLLGMKLDFNQIKAGTDLVRVVESYGVKLKKTGRNYVGRCCFHPDKNPSLIITPAKGLFHCPACGAAGNVIQFVARKEGLTDREAAMKLCQAIPGVTTGNVLKPPTAPAARRAHAVTKGDGQAVATSGQLLWQNLAQGPCRTRLLEDPETGRSDHVGSFPGWL